MSDSRRRTVEDQLLDCIKDPRSAENDQVSGLRRHQITRGVTVLLNNILDHLFEYGTSRDDLAQGDGRGESESIRSFVSACEDASVRISTLSFESATHLAGSIAFVGLNVELLRRRFEPPNVNDQAESDARCHNLLQRPGIKAAIYAIYSSAQRSSDASRREEEAWSRLDPDSFAYYKAGTTSAILTVGYRGQSGNAASSLVLKCVLFPWNKMSAIAKATQSYVDHYGAGQTPASVVQPIASTKKWVLMPRQEGETLRERINRVRALPDVEPGRLIEEARDTATSLTKALGLLASATREVVREPVHSRIGSQHLDLSPSNVIIAPDGPAKLIDLGRNHLYSRQVGIAEHDDSVYVAPEVKNRGSSSSSDMYSLGIIIIEILAGTPPRDGRVPDSIYELSPTLGRALDDLLEEDPQRRLLLIRDGNEPIYQRLAEALDAAFIQAKAEPAAEASAGWRIYAKYAPSSRELISQWRKWRESGSDSLDARYLLLFSLLATVTWWFIFARVAIPQVTDFIEEFPKPPDRPSAAALIGFAQGLVVAKYYQTIAARLTVRHINVRFSRLTEISMRAAPFVALPTALVAVSWREDLWAWSCAFGALLIALTNLLMLLTAREIFASGGRAGFTTVPPADRQFPRGFEQWWYTMLVYACVIAVIAVGLDLGWMRDEGAYVFGLLVINLGIHYVTKCSLAGPAIRGGIARSIALGERVSIHRAREAARTPGPERDGDSRSA